MTDKEKTLLEKYKIIIENFNDWIWELDKDGMHTYNNKFIYETLGVTPKILDEDALELVHPEDRTLYIETYKKAVRTKTGWNGIIIRWKAKNGTFKYLNSSSQPIFEKDGSLKGFIGIDRDITEQEEAKKELIKKKQELNKLLVSKDKFFNIIAHDLRSPFNSIIGFSEILLEKNEILSSQENKESVLIMLNTAKNTFRLLENLLTWASIEAGNMNCHPKTSSLNTIIREVELEISGIANFKQIDINIDFPENISIYYDVDMLKTILRNLLTNAIKFSSKGSSVSIFVKQEHFNSIISVVDNGVGINIEKQQKLFDITEKYSTIGTSGEKGSGLGLILCKEFVEMHGGKINVKSKENIGTTIRFTIPEKKVKVDNIK